MSSTDLRSAHTQRRTRVRRNGSLAAALLATALSLAPLAGEAADAEGRFAVKGAGATRCADYVATFDERGQNLYLYAGWLEGYLTAANQHLDKTYDLAAWETLQTLAILLSNHCRSNPELSFLDATRVMFNALQGSRIEKGSELVIAGDADTGARMYRETLRRVQTTLAKEGFYTGEVDGLYGTGTKTAVRAFQEKAGLEPTGVPDQNTLMQILRGGTNGSATAVPAAAPAPGTAQ